MTSPPASFPSPGWSRTTELTWDWDDMHMPSALTPLAGDYAQVIGGGFAYGYERLELPDRVRARVWNGYVYFAFTVDGTDAEQAAAGERYTAARRQAIESATPTGAGRAIPELTSSTPGSRHDRSGRRRWLTWPRSGTRSGRASPAPGGFTSMRSAGRTRSWTTWPTSTNRRR